MPDDFFIAFDSSSGGMSLVPLEIYPTIVNKNEFLFCYTRDIRKVSRCARTYIDKTVSLCLRVIFL
jgi:hypothetical protein